MIIKPYFINTKIILKQRTPDEIDGIKSESLIIELEYESDGDTSKMTSLEIIEEIKKRLEKDEFGLYKTAKNYNRCRNDIIRKRL